VPSERAVDVVVHDVPNPSVIEFDDGDFQTDIIATVTAGEVVGEVERVCQPRSEFWSSLALLRVHQRRRRRGRGPGCTMDPDSLMDLAAVAGETARLLRQHQEGGS
jgi:hypothetical protein